VADPGQHPGGTFAARLQATAVAIGATRRETLAAWVRQLELLLVEAQGRLGHGHAALAAAQQRYRTEFGLGSRLNPFDRARRQHHARHIEPLDRVVAADRALMRQCGLLLEATRVAAAPVEWRTNWKGGIAGVYNHQTGQAEWREKWHHGVAGIWNPRTGQTEWREKWKHGVAGVWNPRTSHIEWRGKRHGGVAGVWNPDRGEIEWREKWHHGVAGVWNPVARQVEWKEGWKGGVAGAFNPATGQIVWKEHWKQGVACLAFDGKTYVSSGSYYGDEDDD
jgi:hypothetical protein